MLEADTKAKLEEAGIPVFGLADKGDDGNARLIVMVTLDRPNGFTYPIETEVKLLQRVRLFRDPSIEFDATTWSFGGTGNKLEIPMVRRQIADEIDRFVQDYLSVNPKQSANSTMQKSR